MACTSPASEPESASTSATLPPLPRTPLIGRERDIKTISALLRDNQDSILLPPRR